MARVEHPDRGLARDLIVPEGANLGVQLASAGNRASAFILDAAIMAATMFVVALVLVFGLAHYGVAGAEPIAIAAMLFFFLLRNSYFILFEGGGRAATPGKRIVGIRVVSRDGTGLSIDQVIARNLMREIEVFLPLTLLVVDASIDAIDTLTTILGLLWALLFSFFPLFNRDRMRIGDLLAGTWVVHAPRRQLLADLGMDAAPAAGGFRFSDAQLDAYGIAELHRLEAVLRGDNEEACWIVARAIATKIGWAEDIADARPFLNAYYNGLRAHLERELLFGVRRADKYS